MRKFLKYLRDKLFHDKEKKKTLNQIKLINGSILVNQNKLSAKNILQSEAKVFSQFGEDGIIQYILNNVDITEKKFIEFGVENYEEANTRFLLEAYNWNGLIIDSSKKNTNFIKNQDYYWKYNLKVENKFINAENINSIISASGFKDKIGLLSIDIDGNDYWIWKSINCIEPELVIVEYNARFGPNKSVTIDYDPEFNRYKNNKLVYGASLSALNKLGNEKGYSLICTNSNGNNAFFLKKNLLNEKIEEISVQQAFNKNSFKEMINTNDTDYFEKGIQSSKLIEV